MTGVATATPEKKEYEIAVDTYVEAEKKYRDLESYFLSGDFLQDVLSTSEGDAEKMKREFRALTSQLKEALEDLNVKLSSAKLAMRGAVALAPSQQRGPDGRATTLSYGPLTVSSATSRWFDPEDLLKGAKALNVLDRLMLLTGFDKDGKQYQLVQLTYEIDYPNVLKWLKEQNLAGLIDAAYDEMEKTPLVSGAKPLAFLGQKIEK